MGYVQWFIQTFIRDLDATQLACHTCTYHVHILIIALQVGVDAKQLQHRHEGHTTFEAGPDSNEA